MASCAARSAAKRFRRDAADPVHEAVQRKRDTECLIADNERGRTGSLDASRGSAVLSQSLPRPRPTTAGVKGSGIGDACFRREPLPTRHAD